MTRQLLSPKRKSPKRSPKRRSPKRSPKRKSPKRSPKRRSPKRSPKRRSPKRSPKRSSPKRRSPKEGGKVPNTVKNPKLYLTIKNKIKRKVLKQKRRWGAYDSGRLVIEYKAAGGKYSKKTLKKSGNLSRWYQEKWIDACAWPKRKSCGRTHASSSSKPTYCRPSVRINKYTPLTITEIQKSDIRRRCQKKKSKTY